MNSVFVRMLVAKRVLRLLLALGIALVGGVGSSPSTATSVTPLSLNEIVRGVDAIVVGTITGQQSRWGDASQRWMQTDYTLAVEDVVYPSEQGVPIGQTIVLTYWGGTIGGETQNAAGIRLPINGERLVVMLHSRWAQGGTLAPTMGFDQGLFSVAVDAAGGKLVLRDAAGQPLALTTAGQIVRGDMTAAVAAGATALDLTTFTKWLRANITSIKAAPATPKPKVDQNDPRIMKVFAKTPALPGSSAPVSANAIAPAQGPAAEVGAGVPAAPSATGALPVLAASVPETMTIPPGPNWSSNHQWQSLPIVVNQFPIDGSFAPWSPEDQYQLSKWNYYDDIFRVYVTPTGTYLWGDGVNDLAGWLTDAETFSMYGAHLDCGAGCQVLAVTYMRFNSGGWILEGDIVMNAAITWTLDDEWAWGGGAATTFRQSMIHEMGHLHGLNHNFTFLALMNYFNPSKWRFFGMPFMDDTQAIRWEYPANAVGLTDLAIYPYYQSSSPCYDGTTFFNCISDETFPSSVAHGTSFLVNNYHVENVGTTTISTPTIEWYLTAARNFVSATYYLGTSTYPSLPSNTYFTPSTVGRTFTVPASVPVGNYYLAAYIRNDDGGSGGRVGAEQGGFPFGNNFAFSRLRMTVAPLVPGAPNIGTATAGNASASVAFTAPASNGGPAIDNYRATCGGHTATRTFSPINVTGLTNGITYTCTVAAHNSDGWSAESSASNSFIPATVPGAPTIGTATAGNASASVAFTPPASNGGAAINNYRATCGGHTGFGASSPINVTGLNNGTAYTCTVAAHNSVGWSAESGTASVTLPAVPPDAPTNVSAVATGNGSITVNFGPPASNGGAAITGYLATCTSSNGGVSGSNTGGATAVSIVVSGLTDGKIYTCRVTATNAAALTGPASTPSNAVALVDLTPILMLLLD